jgi:hypothetical protein
MVISDRNSGKLGADGTYSVSLTPLTRDKLVNVPSVRIYHNLSASSPSRCLDLGDVDLFHLHHRLEGALCPAATSRKRVR